MTEYLITDGNGTAAVILPEKGGTVVSLSRNGVEFLYRDQENLDSPERPRCGIPFLFPIFGRLKDGIYQWDGQAYAMEIHGFGHTSSWKVISHTDNQLVMELTADNHTLSIYPFLFRAELTLTVGDGRLSIAQRFENHGSTTMPYSFGFHPYFLVDDLSHIQVETSAGIYFDFAAGKPAPFGHGRVSLSLPEGAPETGAAFMEVVGPTMLHIPSEGRRITMENDGNYPQLVLWTQAQKRFLCVEPINGTANGFNTGVYSTLHPGESAHAVLNLCIETI